MCGHAFFVRGNLVILEKNADFNNHLRGERAVKAGQSEVLRRTYLLLCLYAIFAVLPASALALPRTYDAFYVINKGVLSLARVHVSLKPQSQPGVYRYQSSAEMIGLMSWFNKSRVHEYSILEWQGDTPRPLEYGYEETEGKKKKHAVHISFLWEKGTAHINIDDRQIRQSITPDILDRFSFQFMLTWNLRRGLPLRDYTILDEGQLKTYKIERLREESIRTPIGSFDTIAFARVSGDRKTVFWLAPKLDYLPVRIDTYKQDQHTLSMSLDEMHGLQP